MGGGRSTGFFSDGVSWEGVVGRPRRQASRVAATKGVVFVGFDASQPLVNALKQGKLQGIVVQNPYKMGALGVRTLVDHLEKKEVLRQDLDRGDAGHAREYG